MKPRNAAKATLKSGSRVFCLSCKLKQDYQGLDFNLDTHAETHHPLEFSDVIPNSIYYELCWRFKRKAGELKLKTLLITLVERNQ